MLPLPYAPNIDVDAERLRMAREEGARPPVDVAAGVGPAIQGAMTLDAALKEGRKKEAAEIFQKEYLQRGNEGIQKMYADAGSPKDFNINAYLIPEGTPSDKAQEIALLAAKDLAAKTEKIKLEKGASDFADAYETGGGDKAVGAAIRGGVVKPETVVTQMEQTKRKKMETEGRAELAKAKREFDAIQKGLDRGLARLKIAAKTTATKDLQREYENLTADYEDYRKQIDDLEAAGVYSEAEKGKLTDLRTRARDVERRMRNAEARLPAEVVATAGTEAPTPEPKTTGTGGLTAESTDAEIAAALKAAGKPSTPANVSAVKKKLTSGG